MKIIDRYLIREFLVVFFYCLLVFISLYIIIDLFTHLSDILRNHTSLKYILKYYGTFIPVISIQIMPIAILISTLYTFNNFNRYNEITAMRASGISLWQLILPFLITGFILSSISLIMNEKVIPQAFLISTTTREREIEKKPKFKGGGKIIKNVAFYGRENRMFYIKIFDQKENTLSSIIILEHNNQQHLRSRLTAEKAKFENGRWKFYNAIIYPLDRTGQLTDEPLFYKQKIIDLPEKPDDFVLSQYQTEFMSYSQLKKYVNRFSSSGYQPTKELVDLYNKISYPFINFVIILIGIPFALRQTRGGTLMYIGIGMGIGFIFYGFIATSAALGKAGILPPLVSAWLPNITFCTCGFLMLAKLNR